MDSEATRILAAPTVALAMSAAAIVLLSRLAPMLGLVDVPGGRKVHGHPVPLVGGLAIFSALLGATWALGIASSAGHFLFGLSIIIFVGLWDDVAEISPRLKFAIQILAALFMIWGAGVELRSVGDLLGWRPIGLTMFAIPLTIFAVVGVVNAVNMLDGLDGLGGSVALVAFAWYAIVAADSALDVQSKTALIFCGALGGFLLFNLRFPWQPHARVFLGDAGSLMIGFALSWFAIDLTQGQGRTFPPIAALWVMLLPLADCVSLITRRLRSGGNPFVGDRRHIHHYLMARGFTHGQTLATLVALSATFGAIGYLGWKFAVPEPVLFYPFFFGFFMFHFWIQREWKRIERRDAGIPSELPAEPEKAARGA